MDVLRSTMVEAAFRPPAEEPRSLLDFVDEQGVETMRNALKESIRESKVHPFIHIIKPRPNINPGSTDQFRFLNPLL